MTMTLPLHLRDSNIPAIGDPLHVENHAVPPQFLIMRLRSAPADPFRHMMDPSILAPDSIFAKWRYGKGARKRSKAANDAINTPAEAQYLRFVSCVLSYLDIEVCNWVSRPTCFSCQFPFFNMKFDSDATLTLQRDGRAEPRTPSWTGGRVACSPRSRSKSEPRGTGRNGRRRFPSRQFDPKMIEWMLGGPGTGKHRIFIVSSVQPILMDNG